MSKTILSPHQNHAGPDENTSYSVNTDMHTHMRMYAVYLNVRTWRQIH